MKHPSIFLSVVFFLITGLNCFSQNEKTFLFKDNPVKVRCSVNELNKVFAEKKATDVELMLSDDFKIKGTIISSEMKYSNLQSVLIQMPSFNNSICHFSKIINADQSIVYSGQIINQAFEECYLLKKDINNIYQFIKMDLNEIRPTCSMP